MASHCDAQSSPSTRGSTTSWVRDSKNNPFCWCGVHSCLKTAYTDGNFGRRFFTCVNHNIERSCQFFSWFDPPMCVNGRRVLRRLWERHEKTHVEEEDSLKINLTMERNLTNRLRLELASTKFSHNKDLKFYRRLLFISLVVIGVLFLLLLPSICVRRKVVGLCLALAP